MSFLKSGVLESARVLDAVVGARRGLASPSLAVALFVARLAVPCKSKNDGQLDRIQP